LFSNGNLLINPLMIRQTVMSRRYKRFYDRNLLHDELLTRLHNMGCFKHRESTIQIERANMPCQSIAHTKSFDVG
jgi:hypothetical protein